jgi:hypothetical protein
MESKYILPFLLSRPFEPFWICTFGGRDILILSNEMVSYNKHVAALWITTPEGPLEVLELSAVASIRTRGEADASQFKDSSESE